MTPRLFRRRSSPTGRDRYPFRRSRTAPRPVDPQLAPYFDQRCEVVVHCRLCGGEHAHRARLRATAFDGEVVLAGTVFRVEEILSIRLADEPLEIGHDLSWFLPPLLLFATLLAWLVRLYR